MSKVGEDATKIGVVLYDQQNAVFFTNIFAVIPSWFDAETAAKAELGRIRRFHSIERWRRV